MDPYSDPNDRPDCQACRNTGQVVDCGDDGIVPLVEFLSFGSGSAISLAAGLYFPELCRDCRAESIEDDRTRISTLVACIFEEFRRIPIEEVEDWAAGVLEHVRTSHTVGAILDPTKYRDELQGGLLDGLSDVARDFLALRRTVEKYDPRKKVGIK